MAPAGRIVVVQLVCVSVSGYVVMNHLDAFAEEPFLLQRRPASYLSAAPPSLNPSHFSLSCSPSSLLVLITIGPRLRLRLRAQVISFLRALRVFSEELVLSSLGGVVGLLMMPAVFLPFLAVNAASS